MLTMLRHLRPYLATVKALRNDPASLSLLRRLSQSPDAWTREAATLALTYTGSPADL